MQDAFDPDRLRLHRSDVPLAAPRSPSPRLRRAGGQFLKGPIPWAWLLAAGKQPGKALHVGIALWFEAGRTRSNKVPLSLTGMERTMEVSRFAAARGLAALEKAGLV